MRGLRLSLCILEEESVKYEKIKKNKDYGMFSCFLSSLVRGNEFILESADFCFLDCQT